MSKPQEIKWYAKQHDTHGLLTCLTMRFKDRDGGPWWYAQSWQGEPDDEFKKNAQRFFEEEWAHDFDKRLRHAEVLGCNVREVPHVGDAAHKGQSFTPKAKVTVENNMVTRVDWSHAG